MIECRAIASDHPGERAASLQKLGLYERFIDRPFDALDNSDGHVPNLIDRITECVKGNFHY